MAKNLSSIWDRIIGLFGGKLSKLLDYNNAKSLHKFSNKKNRTYLTKNETLQFNVMTKLQIEKINLEAKGIFKQYIHDPEGLLEYIQSQGTPVIRVSYIEKLLTLLGENEGFIYPLKGIKASILALIINILSPVKIPKSDVTPAMFVMSNKPISVYLLGHQFHHWMSYINGLPGYEDKTVSNFKDIWDPGFGSSDIASLSIDEILSLKDAIARDLEAIKFIKDVTREVIGQKLSSDRLKNGEKISI